MKLFIDLFVCINIISARTGVAKTSVDSQLIIKLIENLDLIKNIFQAVNVKKRAYSEKLWQTDWK